MNYPFSEISNGFKVEVFTEFDFGRSNPLNFIYFFSYHVKITNLEHDWAQLLSRKWFIRDAQGDEKIVEGPGVIGYTPTFNKEDSFDYQSFSPIPTLTGEMWGYFNMIDKYGKNFKIDTPKFKFKVPDEFIDQY